MSGSIARNALAGVAALATLAGGLGAPTQAAAQQSRYYDAQSGYDDQACEREKDGRTVAGAVVGGLIGAVIGSQVAGDGARTEGSVIAGGAGAIGGGAIGRSSVDCSQGQSTYAEGYDARAQRGRGYYDAGPSDARYDDADSADYDYDRDFRPASQGGPEDCRLAESAIYMPDGRLQKRFVRVCRDVSGRYQVVE